MPSVVSEAISHAPVVPDASEGHVAVHAAAPLVSESFVSDRCAAPPTNWYPATIRSPPLGSWSTAFAAPASDTHDHSTLPALGPLPTSFRANAMLVDEPDDLIALPTMTMPPSDVEHPCTACGSSSVLAGER